MQAHQIITSILLTFVINTCYGDVLPQMVTTDFWKFTIYGSIDQNDATRFEKIQEAAKIYKEQYKKKVAIITYLDSPGGDVNASMSIGRALRNLDSLVHVDEGSTCASSCVLVLAGAGRRYVDLKSRVGIHRPYRIDSESSTPENEKRKYLELGKIVEAYLDSMNVNNRLFSDMLRISPKDIKFLTKDELVAYGIWNDDPYIEEADAMRQAVKNKISRKELVRREALADQRCQGYDPNNGNEVIKKLNCIDSIIKNGR